MAIKLPEMLGFLKLPAWRRYYGPIGALGSLASIIALFPALYGSGSDKRQVAAPELSAPRRKIEPSKPVPNGEVAQAGSQQTLGEVGPKPTAVATQRGSVRRRATQGSSSHLKVSAATAEDDEVEPPAKAGMKTSGKCSPNFQNVSVGGSLEIC